MCLRGFLLLCPLCPSLFDKASTLHICLIMSCRPVRETAPGNGGCTDRYVWTQQLGELAVQVPVPIGTRSRDLVVDIGKPQPSVCACHTS